MNIELLHRVQAAGAGGDPLATPQASKPQMVMEQEKPKISVNSQ